MKLIFTERDIQPILTDPFLPIITELNILCIGTSQEIEYLKDNINSLGVDQCVK